MLIAVTLLKYLVMVDRVAWRIVVGGYRAPT